jgi:hypothetical protein
MCSSRCPPAIREYPMFAGSVRVLLEEKLLHGRRNWNNALVGFWLPTDVGLGLNEQDSELEIQIVPPQMLDLTFPHPCEQNRGEQPTFVLAACSEELPDLLGCHEARQGPLRHTELLDVRHRIHKQMILFDRPPEKRKESLQLVVDGPNGNARMNGMPPKPSILRIRLHGVPLRIARQL